jgi:hypothetical protein
MPLNIVMRLLPHYRMLFLLKHLGTVDLHGNMEGGGAFMSNTNYQRIEIQC